MKAETLTTMFEELCGEQLSAVTFVQDYLQLWFDGPCINVNNPLTVDTAAGKITSWQPGFRDLLCAQIAKVVSTIEYHPSVALVIRFSDSSSLVVSLEANDYTTPEAYFAHGFADNQWAVA